MEDEMGQGKSAQDGPEVHIPPAQRCVSEHDCGKGWVCADPVFRGGYCLNPKQRLDSQVTSGPQAGAVPQLQEQEDAACAQLLIELAFLLPSGTDVMAHPISEKLRRYVAAIRANKSAGPVPDGITALRDWLESQEFDTLMYAYRSAPRTPQLEVGAAFIQVQKAILDKASEVLAARSVVAPRERF